MSKIVHATLLTLILWSGAFGQEKKVNDLWLERLQLLLGVWTASGDTQLGSGEGGFSFGLGLDGHIIVRRNFAEYKTAKAAGTRHDDLMIIYLDTGATAAPQAIYFDSEGHIIRYTLSFPDVGKAVFDSDVSQPGPKYRLSYSLDGKILSGKFEIATSNNDFKTYLNWTSQRANIFEGQMSQSYSPILSSETAGHVSIHSIVLSS